MATAGFSNFRSSAVTCSATPQPNHHSERETKASSSANWWVPLFGWSSDPDYIQSSKKAGSGHVQKDGEIGRPTRSRLVLGSFNDEKAKELRRMTRETSTFHDIMYHSAIAARLASDMTGRPQEE